MKVPFVDLNAQYQRVKPEIDSAIAEVITGAPEVGQRQVETFERAWASVLGVKHCVSCASDRDAIHVALRALGITSGAEVITSAHGWIATIEAIQQTGARVVFCDTDEETFTIDPEDVRRKVTKATVGIIPVHLYGQAAEMHAILNIAREHKLWVIEDCSQAHLARYHGRYVGTLGDAAVFSFCPGRNLSAYGHAGCIVTNHDPIAEALRAAARHVFAGGDASQGAGSRMDGVQAAVLNAKLPHLPSWTRARRLIAACYDYLFEEIGDIIIPKVGSQREHVYNCYVIRTENRDALRKHLTQAGVATAVNYPEALPLAVAHEGLCRATTDFPVASFNQSRILSLPIYPEMTQEMVSYVAECINTFFGEPESVSMKVIPFAPPLWSSNS